MEGIGSLPAWVGEVWADGETVWKHGASDF